MYEMLVNYRHGAYYPIGTMSALSDLSKEAIEEGINSAFFKLVAPSDPVIPPSVPVTKTTK